MLNPSRSVREDLREEQLGARLFRIAEDLLRRPALHDPPLVEEIHRVGHRAGEAHLVRHHHHRHPALGQLGHHVEHLFDHLQVQRAGWLVEEHDLGLHRQRPRDRHALLLAAGELAGVLAGLLGDAHTPQQLHRHLLGLGARPASRCGPTGWTRRAAGRLTRIRCCGQPTRAPAPCCWSRRTTPPAR